MVITVVLATEKTHPDRSDKKRILEVVGEGFGLNLMGYIKYLEDVILQC